MNAMTLTNQGTGLSCAEVISSAPRLGTGLPVSAHENRGMRRLGLRWATTDFTLRAPATVNAAYPQVEVDVPTIKQFRVPLSIRERSS